MRRRVKGIMLLFVVTALGGVGSGCAAHLPVMFTAMGCGPYNSEDENALIWYMKQECLAPRSEFVVHLGDIAAQSSMNYDNAYYAKIASILGGDNCVPVFIVPGDNEWNDQPDPDAAWQSWSKHFMRFDERFDFAPSVVRQPGRPENFAFLLKGVLFIGINKVGGAVHDQDEWRRRLEADAQWISHHLAGRGRHARAAVIFAQAAAFGFEDQFLTPFRAAAVRFAKPILYLHADGHQWLVVSGQWAPNIVQVQVDRVNGEFPPVRFTVTTDREKPFLFHRRLGRSFDAHRAKSAPAASD